MNVRRHAVSFLCAGLGLAFLALHALAAHLGWADGASALSGTPVAGASVFQGVAYVGLRLLALVVAPVLLLAAALRPLWLALLERPCATGG